MVVAVSVVIAGVVLAVLLSPKSVPKSGAIPDVYGEQIRQAGYEFGVPSALIAGVIRAESNGRADALGDTNLSQPAYGLMQIRQPALDDVRNVLGWLSLPEVAGEWLYSPDINVRVGAAFLSLQRRRMGTDFDALRAYNAGAAGATRSASVSREYAERVERFAEEYRAAGYFV